MSVCPHVPRMMAASSGRISMKFDTGDFHEDVANFKRGYNSATIWGKILYFVDRASGYSSC